MEVLVKQPPMLAEYFVSYKIKMDKKRYYLETFWPQFCEELATIICSPLVDLFFLFTSWKYSNSICSVFIAGLNHTTSLYTFLVDNEYFYSEFYFGDHKDINDIIKDEYKLPEYLPPYYEYWSIIQQSIIKEPLKRCIQFNFKKENNNIDDILNKYWLNIYKEFSSQNGKENKKKELVKVIIDELYKQQMIIKDRINCISYDIFIRVMSGEVLSSSDLNNSFNQYIITNQLINTEEQKKIFLLKCNFSSSYILNEYNEKVILH